jgi:hypothetical protein
MRAMLRCQKFLVSIICLSILLSTISSNADEEIEDLIDIAKSKNKIIAIIEGSKKISFALGANEKVLWHGSKGHLGAFLTDRKFSVISTSSSAWQILPLKIEESEKSVASLSSYIALLVTGDRAVGFDAGSNRFIETQLPIHDELLAAEIEKRVAVVVTSSRAFGLAVDASAFTEIHFRVRETIDQIKLTSSKVTIQTSDRLLTFDPARSTWNEYKLN